MREELGGLKGSQQTPLCDSMGLQVCDVLPFEEYRTGVGRETPGDQVEEGGFAGAVWADNRLDIPGARGETHVLYGVQPAEIPVEINCFK